jgi:hypothetical protein
MRRPWPNGDCRAKNKQNRVCILKPSYPKCYTYGQAALVLSESYRTMRKFEARIVCATEPKYKIKTIFVTPAQNKNIGGFLAKCVMMP